MTVLEIVKKYLEKNDYDGLFNSDVGCACLIDDLAPCGQISEWCEAGYKLPCDCGENCGWHIGIKRSGAIIGSGNE